MIHYASVPPATSDVVLSVVPGYYYPCPDAASVDGHLHAQHRDFLGPTANVTPFRRAKALADVDRLLEQRIWITEVAA